MNNSKLLFSVALSSLLIIQQADASDIITNTAKLQAMDKITGKVSEVNVPVNGLANFGSFSILVRKCVTKSPEETPENTAFVDIVDNYRTDNPVNIFKGWMFSSTPALNAVEHPIYDIWLLKCYNTNTEGRKLLSEEQLALRDTLPIQRQTPVMVSTSIGEVEETSSSSSTSATKEITPEDKEIVNLNIEAIAASSEEQNNTDEEFVSEDDEVENSDTDSIAENPVEPQPTEETPSEPENNIQE